MSSRHDIVIDGHYINTLRAQYGSETQTAALRELIDNAVDANATLIEIIFDGKDNSITISDDGDGCSDISLFFNIGCSDKVDSVAGKIGRYGIGGTWASLYLCDTEYVYTVSRSDNRRQVAKMRWTDAAERKIPFRWEMQSQRKANADDLHGTRIVLSGIRKGNSASRNIFAPVNITRLQELLARTYGAAIAGRGMVIGINGNPVEPAAPPRMVDGCSELEIAGEWQGHPWHLRARHIAHDQAAQTWKPGVYVAYRGRLLNADARPWTSGLGQHVGAPVWVWIELTDGATVSWSLNWDKSDFEDRQLMLSDVLASDRVQIFLREVDDRAQDLDSKLIGNDLSAMLNETLSFGSVLEKRPGDAGEKGTVIPISTGIERRRATVVDKTKPGTIDEERPRQVRTRSWRVVPQDLGANGQLCEVEVSSVKRRTHGAVVADQFHVTVTVNTFLPEQIERLRDRSTAMALIAPSVAHKLAREHIEEFRQVYCQLVNPLGEQDELFCTVSQAERLAHALMVRQAQSVDKETERNRKDGT